jgi:hypothetical protein
MENSKKHDSKDRIDFVNEPILEYGNEKKEFDEAEFHPILIQLLEKSIKESEEGKGSTTEEVMKRVKEKYPFLK